MKVILGFYAQRDSLHELADFVVILSDSLNSEAIGAGQLEMPRQSLGQT